MAESRPAARESRRPPDARTVRDAHLDLERLPSCSLVQVAGLVHPGARVEIEAVAETGAV